jgi:hypothetical protein
VKILILLFVALLLTQNSWATRRPEPPRPEVTRPRGEIPRSLVEKVDTLNREVREILGSDRLPKAFELRPPEGLTGSKLQRYERDIDEFLTTLRSQRDDLTQDNYRGIEMANFLQTLNSVYAARNNVKDFMDSQRLSADHQQISQRFLDFIDNLMTIQLSKMTETADSPLSQETILLTMRVINDLPVARMQMQHLIDAEAQITGMLPRDYNMRNAANCVR